MKRQPAGGHHLYNNHEHDNGAEYRSSSMVPSDALHQHVAADDVNSISHHSSSSNNTTKKKYSKENYNTLREELNDLKLLRRQLEKDIHNTDQRDEEEEARSHATREGFSSPPRRKRQLTTTATTTTTKARRPARSRGRSRASSNASSSNLTTASGASRNTKSTRPNSRRATPSSTTQKKKRRKKTATSRRVRTPAALRRNASQSNNNNTTSSTTRKKKKSTKYQKYLSQYKSLCASELKSRDMLLSIAHAEAENQLALLRLKGEIQRWKRENPKMKPGHSVEAMEAQMQQLRKKRWQPRYERVVKKLEHTCEKRTRMEKKFLSNDATAAEAHSNNNNQLLHVPNNHATTTSQLLSPRSPKSAKKLRKFQTSLRRKMEMHLLQVHQSILHYRHHQVQYVQKQRELFLEETMSSLSSAYLFLNKKRFINKLSAISDQHVKWLDETRNMCQSMIDLPRKIPQFSSAATGDSSPQRTQLSTIHVSRNGNIELIGVDQEDELQSVDQAAPIKTPPTPFSTESHHDIFASAHGAITASKRMEQNLFHDSNSHDDTDSEVTMSSESDTLPPASASATSLYELGEMASDEEGSQNHTDSDTVSSTSAGSHNGAPPSTSTTSSAQFTHLTASSAFIGTPTPLKGALLSSARTEDDDALSFSSLSTHKPYPSSSSRERRHTLDEDAIHSRLQSIASSGNSSIYSLNRLLEAHGNSPVLKGNDSSREKSSLFSTPETDTNRSKSASSYKPSTLTSQNRNSVSSYRLQSPILSRSPLIASSRTQQQRSSTTSMEQSTSNRSSAEEDTVSAGLLGLLTELQSQGSTATSGTAVDESEESLVRHPHLNAARDRYRLARQRKAQSTRNLFSASKSTESPPLSGKTFFRPRSTPRKREARKSPHRQREKKSVEKAELKKGPVVPKLRNLPGNSPSPKRGTYLGESASSSSRQSRHLHSTQNTRPVPSGSLSARSPASQRRRRKASLISNEKDSILQTSSELLEDVHTFLSSYHSPSSTPQQVQSARERNTRTRKTNRPATKSPPPRSSHRERTPKNSLLERHESYVDLHKHPSFKNKMKRHKTHTNIMDVQFEPDPSEEAWYQSKMSELNSLREKLQSEPTSPR